MKKVKNIVYLYSEVMPYAIAVMRALVHEFDVLVDCISWDQNKRTPFVPVDEKGIIFHKRSSFNEESIIKFIEERGPSVMYVCGRMDKLYLKAAVHFKHKCHIVAGSDNQWTGGPRQWLATVLSPLLYWKYFEYFWVPGRRQYEYARRMGYPNDKIIRNLLTADTDVFGNVHERNIGLKKQKYPHNIVYAGRFAREKGVDALIQAFTEAKNEMDNDWQLILVGSGDLPVTSAPFIQVKGFMQGPELMDGCKEWGVCCLPSNYEPWGVVIHEFAMAGLPILCSDSVGAVDDLVINNYNGVVFKSGDREDLKKSIKEIMMKSDEELRAMGARGHELSKMQSPVIAAYSLMSIMS